ncbi:MAG: PhoX family protein, partial [Casimicrobium sp.]
MAQIIRDDDGVSNPSNRQSFAELVEAMQVNPRRRMLLKSGAGLAAIPFLGGLAACGSDDDATTPPVSSEKMLGFANVPISTGDTIVVPSGYVASAIIPWGTPLLAGAPA